MRTRNALAILIILLKTSVYAQTQKAILDGAYNNNSLKQLDKFFKTWNREIRPISTKELAKLSDTIQNIYNVYYTFYKPVSNSDFLLDSAKASDFYSNISYAILPDDVIFSFTDKLYYDAKETNDYITQTVNKYIKADSTRQKILKFEGKYSQSATEMFGPSSKSLFYQEKVLFADTIENFRPQIRINRKVLFLNNTYRTLLNEFIGNDVTEVETGDSSYLSGESVKKVEFLSNRIKVIPSHWIGWKYYTFPLILKITFDQNMQYAKLIFKIKYSYGEALLKKENNEWKVVSIEDTWGE
jgi:hypothetical protein